jgi:HEAT repeat protein
VVFGTVLSLWIGTVAAQPSLSDPVEQLRQTLKASAHDLEQRDRNLKEKTNALQSVSDLRRAIMLKEWRDTDSNPQLAEIDLSARQALTQRFGDSVRRVLQQGDMTSRLAVLNMLTELGTTMPEPGSRKSLASRFAGDLVELMKSGDPAMKEATARTLGLINPDPAVALPALKSMLDSKNVSQRMAAVESLVNLMHVMAQLISQHGNPFAVETSRKEVVQLGCAVVPLAARTLQDDQAGVRRGAVEAIGKAAQTLSQLVLTSSSTNMIVEDSERYQRQLQEERGELMPLIRTLKEQGPALTRALADSDGAVRLLARRALEDMTRPQLRLLERATSIAQDGKLPIAEPLQPSLFIMTSASAKDSLLEGLQATVLALATVMGDADVRARRAAIDVLETLGPAAAPAAPALANALGDPDPFVRWSAARTLGKISPVEAQTVVPELAKLLGDLDLDLRLAAATALERYGPAAKAAVGELMRATRSSDPVVRVATIRALGAIGEPDAHVAIPWLVEAVSDENAHVREMAAEVLGKFGPAAHAAVDDLRKALKDDSPDVQKAAGDALLKIVKPSKP